MLDKAAASDDLTRKLEAAESLAMLDERHLLPDVQDLVTDFVDPSNAPLSLEISLRRRRLAVLVSVATIIVVSVTVFLSHGTALTRFDRRAVNATEEKRLLDRYNSYSGNVASAVSRPLELFVMMMAHVVVLWLMTDSVMAFGSSWRVRLTVLALSASVGFLLTNTLNAVNVQVRPRSPTIVMMARDLSVPTNNTNSSTVDKTFSEQTPRNPSANTILRSLILPSASIKSNCSYFSNSMQDDSISYAMPQRTWMKDFLPEALPVSTVRIDLRTNETSGSANDLFTNATIIADLLVSAVYTSAMYAPFDAVTPFNLIQYPPNNSAWYPADANGTIPILWYCC